MGFLIIKKFIYFLFMLFLLSIFVFYMARLSPGDPLKAYYGEKVERISKTQRKEFEQRLGLNKPIFVQYLKWIKEIRKGNFGISFQYKQDVLIVIKDRLLNTLLLGGLSYLITFFLALWLGIFCALEEEKWIDRILFRIGTTISCIPSFWIALLLEEVRKDYVLLAKAKGLTKTKIIFFHCLPNIFPFYLSLMALSIPHILTGTYVVEQVFSYPGLGKLGLESAKYHDYNLLMIICLLTGIFVFVSNLAAEFLSKKIDPRMRETEGNFL